MPLLGLFCPLVIRFYPTCAHKCFIGSHKWPTSALSVVTSGLQVAYKYPTCGPLVGYKRLSGVRNCWAGGVKANSAWPAAVPALANRRVAFVERTWLGLEVSPRTRLAGLALVEPLHTHGQKQLPPPSAEAHLIQPPGNRCIRQPIFPIEADELGGLHVGRMRAGIGLVDPPTLFTDSRG